MKPPLKKTQLGANYPFRSRFSFRGLSTVGGKGRIGNFCKRGEKVKKFGAEK